MGRLQSLRERCGRSSISRRAGGPPRVGAHRRAALVGGLRGPSQLATLLASMMAFAGCASNITSVQPARLTPVGHFAITSSVSANIPVGAAGESWDAMSDAGDVGGSLDAQEIERVAVAANAIAAHPPAADVQFNLAYGLSRRFELNARVSANAIGLGARVQFLRVSPGIYGALGVHLSGSLSTLPVGRVSDVLTLDEYRRFEVSVPVVVGYSSSTVHLWAGPKIVFAAHRLEATVCLRETDDCADQATARGNGRAVFAAGQLGIALGKRRFWFALEITVGRVAVDADLDVDVRGRTSSYGYSPSGLVVQPAIGLIAWF